MMLHASRSRKLWASFAAIGSVIAAAAPVAEAAMVPEPMAVAEEAVVDGGQSPFSERFPNLVLKTHEGKTVRFYDDLLKGKIVMINFMYAECKGR